MFLLLLFHVKTVKSSKKLGELSQVIYMCKVILFKGHLLNDLIYRILFLIFFPGLKSNDAKAPRGKKHVNPRRQFSDVEISTLDSVYVTIIKGKPSKAVMETTAKALKLDGRQVSESRWKLYTVYTL